MLERPGMREEAAMCHHVHVHAVLSAEDRKAVRKLSGMMIPVYASVLIALFALVAVTGGTRQGELIASSSAPAATR
jgi:hypothetical protein